MTGIYEIRNILDGKKYIGSAKNLEKRWRDHKYYLAKNKHHSILLQRAWDLYGEHNFSFFVLETVEHLEKLTEREQFYLDTFKTYEPENGYNLCKTANSMLGYKYSDDQKRWMSENRKGEKNQHYGKKHSEETKRKIGEKNKNRIRTQEYRDKVAIISKQKMEDLRENNIEEFNRRVEKIKNSRLGKKLSDETKKKLSELAKLRTGSKSGNAKLNYEKAQEMREHRKFGISVAEICKMYNVSKPTVLDIINNKRWTTDE
jgi:hypothetical protein